MCFSDKIVGFQSGEPRIESFAAVSNFGGVRSFYLRFSLRSYVNEYLASDSGVYFCNNCLSETFP